MVKLKDVHIGFVGTCLGLGTLSNVYNLLGYGWVRFFCMALSCFAIIVGFFKIVLYFNTFREEYKNGLVAAMYTTITMSAMLFGSFLYSININFGKSLFLVATYIHMFMIVFYTLYHIILNFKIDFFLPSYFVTYNGLLVSTVSGINLLPPKLALFITYYGIAVYIFILIFLIPRMIKKPIPTNFIQTKNILLAPCSLCFVSYINFNSVEVLKPYFNLNIALILYICVLLTFIYIVINTPKFFENSFAPVFGALTFPMAIGTLAGYRAGLLFSSIEQYKMIGMIANNVAGFQILISSTFMCFVFFNFAKSYLKFNKE